MTGPVNPAPLWLVDWSDSEDDDFRSAWTAAGVPVRVLRSPALGTSVGTWWHRAKSWPSYTALAVGGLTRARAGPVVAWQPLAGAVAGLLRPGRRPPLLVLNPLLSTEDQGRRQQALLRGLRRADRIVFFSRRAVAEATLLGLPAERLTFVHLGAPLRRETPAPTGDFLVAAGRDHRDWDTLLRAAAGLDARIVVLGPSHLSGPPNISVGAPLDRAAFLALLERSAGLVLPLQRRSRTAGQLALLDAMSVGRAVVATRGLGTEDYVSDRTGRLVPAADPEALRHAMEEVLAPGMADTLGRAALEEVAGPLSLERFVLEIDALARDL